VLAWAGPPGALRECEVGLLKAMQRRAWKNAVSRQFRMLHELDLRIIADVIGPATLDDLLNEQYEAVPRNPALGAANISTVLCKSFGLNLGLLTLRSKIGIFGSNRVAS
jgi:hypothetical protein